MLNKSAFFNLNPLVLGSAIIYNLKIEKKNRVMLERRYIHFQNLGEMLKAVTLASVILSTLLEYSENRAKMLTLYWYS
jgi:hypothetical protein